MKRHLTQGATVALLSVLLLNCVAMAGKSMELRSANTYFNQGDMKQAQEWYEKAAEKDTKEGQVYARLVQLYADQKRWPEMTRAFAHLDGCADKPAELKKFKAEAQKVIDQLWMGLWNGSIEQTKEADAALAKGDSAAVRDHFEQARARVVTALEILPNRAEFTKRVGDLYINEFNTLYASEDGFPLLRKAAETYGQLAQAYPDSAEYAVTLTQLYYNVRDYDQARRVVDQALQRHPQHGELLTYAGKARIQQALKMKDDKGEVSAAGKALMAEATGFLNQAIAANPGDPMLVYNLALLYRDMNDPHKALETFGRMEGLLGATPPGELDPQQQGLLFDSWYSIAVLYFQDLPEAEQSAAKAADYFEKCLGLQPDNKGLKFNLGVALVRTGDKAKVLRGKKLMEEGQ